MKKKKTSFLDIFLLTVTCLSLCLFLVSCSEEIQPLTNESPTHPAELQTSFNEVNTDQVLQYTEPSASSMNAPESQQNNLKNAHLSITPQSAYEQLVLSLDFFDESKALAAFPDYTMGKSTDSSEYGSIFYGESGKDIRLDIGKEIPTLTFRAFPEETLASDSAINSIDSISLPRSSYRRAQEQSPEECNFLSVQELIQKTGKILDALGYEDYYFRNIETIKKGSELFPGTAAPADAYGLEAMQVINGLPIYDELSFGAPCASIQYRISEKQSEQLSLFYRWKLIRKEGTPQTIMSAEEARAKAEEYLSHLPLVRGAKAQELFNLELLYAPLQYLNEEGSQNVLFTPAYLICIHVLPEQAGESELDSFKEIIFDAVSGELLTLPTPQFTGNGKG